LRESPPADAGARPGTDPTPFSAKGESCTGATGDFFWDLNRSESHLSGTLGCVCLPWLSHIEVSVGPFGRTYRRGTSLWIRTLGKSLFLPFPPFPLLLPFSHEIGRQHMCELARSDVCDTPHATSRFIFLSQTGDLGKRAEKKEIEGGSVQQQSDC